MRIVYALALSLICALGAMGCGNISFDVEQDIPVTFIDPGKVDPNLPAGAVETEAPLNIDIQAETEKRNTGPASSARLKSLTFTIIMPPQGTFYFATGVSIFISANGLPTREIARLTPIPNTTTISVPPIPDVEMLPYAERGATITATAVGTWPREYTEYVGKVVMTIKV
jgi:hypothetical protein